MTCDVKIISLKDAQTKLQVSRATLDRRVASGAFQKYKMPGSSKVYFNEDEIMNSFKPIQP